MKELNLKDISFPVTQENIFIKSGDNYKKAATYKAIINSEKGNLISIVSNSYKLITNDKAIEYGKKCMKELFDLKNESDIKLYNIISPKTFSFCHIDLICKKSDLRIIKDDYMQFVRVTNSYNKSYRLGFSIGFCRGTCKNGIIFNQNSIDFKFSHSKNVNTEEIDFLIKKNEFGNLKREFIRDLEYLSNLQIEEKYNFPLFCKALDLRFNLNGNSTDLQKEKAKEKLENYQKYFYDKYEKYSTELGNNLYSMYNVITDFSSNSAEFNSSFTNTFNSNQRRAGLWLVDFTQRNKNNLNMDDYLKDYLYLKRN